MKYLFIFLVSFASFAQNENMIYCFSSYNLVEISPGVFKRYHSNIWSELCPKPPPVGDGFPGPLAPDATFDPSGHKGGGGSDETFLVKGPEEGKRTNRTDRQSGVSIIIRETDPVDDFLRTIEERNRENYRMGIRIKQNKEEAYYRTTKWAMEVMPKTFSDINVESMDDILKAAEEGFRGMFPKTYHRKEIKSKTHRELQVHSYLKELQELLYKQSLGIRTQRLQGVTKSIQEQAAGIETIGRYLEEADKRAKTISLTSVDKGPCDDFGQQNVFDNKEYDDRQLVESLSDLKGNKITFNRNDDLFINRISLPSGQEFQIDYGQSKIPYKLTLPGGGALKIHRSEDHGEVVGITNPKGFVTKFGYTDGVLSSRTDALGNVVRWDHQTLIDPLENKTSFKADENSLKIIWPDRHESIFEFDDSDGSLEKLTQEDKSVIYYSYPTINKNTVHIQTDDDLAILKVDQNKQLVHAENNHLIFKRIYKYNTLLQADYFVSKKGDFSHGVEYEHDGRGRIFSYSYFGGEMFRIPPSISYRRDVDGVVVGVKLIADDAYFEWEKKSEDGIYTKDEIFSTGLRVSYKREEAGNLESIENLHEETGLISFFEYDYDLNNNVTSLNYKTDESEDHFHFAYDELDRIVYSGLDEKSFSYDPIGNWVGEGHSIDYRGRLISTPDIKTFYDPKGNMISLEKVQTGRMIDFEWTAANQLKKATIYQDNRKVDELVFFYDALGRRVEKRRTHGFNSKLNYVRRYVYQNGNLFAELDGNYNKIAIYVHGPGIDNPLAMIRDINRNGKFDQEEVFTYTKDHLGSIREVLDFKGRIVQRYSYTAYGEIKISGGNIETPYAYTGRVYDRETNLYFYRARYYCPELKIFLSPDPMGFVGGESNFYRYVLNNPMKFRDPTGMIIHPGIVMGALFGGISGGVGVYIQKKNLRQAIPHAIGGALVGGVMGSGLGTFGLGSVVAYSSIGVGANILGQMSSGNRHLSDINIPSAFVSGVAGGISGVFGVLRGIGRSYILATGTNFLPASLEVLSAGTGKEKKPKKPDC